MFQFLFFKTIVRENERAFLYRDGVFQRLLEPGRFRIFDPAGRYSAETFDVVSKPVDPEKVITLQKTHPHLVEKYFQIVQPGPGEVAIVTINGEVKQVVLPNTTRVFWQIVSQVEIETVNVASRFRVDQAHMDKLSWAQSNIIVKEVINQYEAGQLFIDGELTEQLAPGRHAFWSVERDVRIVKFDLRPQPLEVTAQEILTKDRVGIRVTLTAFYKVVDVAKAAAGAVDLAGVIYRLIQFAIREAVATRTLDDILAARDQIDKQVREFVTDRAGELGFEIGEIGVKDVILPGDVRDLLNKVVDAERTAKANLIRRQEETAATRSLLNTSKLMQDNPLLLRLKELEALEKLVEKVGRIDLHAGNDGAGLGALLSNLYKLQPDDRRDGEK